MTAQWPGHDEVILTTPDSAQPCNSLACALWPESWHNPVPMCAACWDSSRKVAIKYRPGLVIRDRTAAAAPHPPMGRP